MTTTGKRFFLRLFLKLRMPSRHGCSHRRPMPAWRRPSCSYEVMCAIACIRVQPGHEWVVTDRTIRLRWVIGLDFALTLSVRTQTDRICVGSLKMQTHKN
jgi:hypothetical protein